jgi:hypothetical protein
MIDKRRIGACVILLPFILEDTVIVVEDDEEEFLPIVGFDTMRKI